MKSTEASPQHEATHPPWSGVGCYRQGQGLKTNYFFDGYIDSLRDSRLIVAVPDFYRLESV